MDAAVMALIIFSCSITLNPDGSGKAVVEVRQSAPAGDPKAAPTLKNQLALARMVLMGCRGVETWSDLSVGASPDGPVTFKGTAYFKSLDGFHIRIPGAGTQFVTWDKDAKAGGVLKFDPLAGEPLPEPVKLPPDELAKRVAEAQAEWKRKRATMWNEIESTAFDISCKLPGEPPEVTGFRKEADGTLHVTMNGKKFLAALDALVADDKALGDGLQAAGGQGVFSEAFFRQVVQEKIFGGKPPFTATVKGEMKPQFDYAAEVKAAGQLAPAAVAQAEAMVNQLGAKEAADRDAAEKRLVELARTENIRDLLQKHADDADPEVRARVRRVLATPDAIWAEKGVQALLRALAAKAPAAEKQTAAPKAAPEKAAPDKKPE